MCSINGAGDDQGEAIAVDLSGSIYITGRFGGTTLASAGSTITWPTRVGSGSNAFVVRLDPAGVPLWANG